jgi:hypothetical protein
MYGDLPLPHGVDFVAAVIHLPSDTNKTGLLAGPTRQFPIGSRSTPFPYASGSKNRPILRHRP